MFHPLGHPLFCFGLLWCSWFSFSLSLSTMVSNANTVAPFSCWKIIKTVFLEPSIIIIITTCGGCCVLIFLSHVLTWFSSPCFVFSVHLALLFLSFVFWGLKSSSFEDWRSVQLLGLCSFHWGVLGPSRIQLHLVINFIIIIIIIFSSFCSPLLNLFIC